MGKIPDEDTSLRIKRKTLSHLAILQKRLGFHSADELISVLVDVASRSHWTKFDMECLQKFGKIPQVIEGSARTEDEMKVNLGILKQTDTIKAEIMTELKCPNCGAIAWKHGKAKNGIQRFRCPKCGKRFSK